MSFVSRETNERLQQFQTLLERWNPRINLVSPATLPDFQVRHLDDCLQLAEYCMDARGTWLDIGSGGGLPGIVLAISLAHLPVEFTLIESDQRKGAFLRTVIRELDLQNASVLSSRIETAPPQNADYLSARALAPLPLLLSYLNRHLAPNGQAWLMKGRSWRREIDEARRDWRFDLVSFSSKTDPEAAILKITGVSHE